MSGGHGTGTAIVIEPNFPETPIFSVCELHKPENGQLVVTLKRTYSPGNDEILVYLNGSLLFETQYSETSSSTITFTRPLTIEDVVLIVFNRATTPQEPRAYGGARRLLNNQIYTANLEIGALTNTFSFSSRYSPLYHTAKLLRSDLGELIEDVSDDILNITIFQVSQEAQELAVAEIVVPPQYYIRQYVRYKSQINLLRLVYLGEMKKGSYSKALGDLTIQHTSRLPDIDKLLRVLTDNLAPWESQLLGASSTATPVGATRARNKGRYPDAPRRSF